MRTQQFDQVYTIMVASFPSNERRSYEGQKELLSDPNYRLITARDGEDERVIGFLAAWEFPTIRFVEHIAVDETARGDGIGARLMSAYMEESTVPVLLEVELPESELARRRIQFYERLGFHINLYEYVQPTLGVGRPALPLKLMSYPDRLTEEQFVNFRNVLYKQVYRVSAIGSLPRL